MKAILRSVFLVLAIMALAVPANAGPYEDGVAAYKRGDYATALNFWRPLADSMRLLAEQGDAEAQLYIGFMYANGQGVVQDIVEAVKWYRRAAEQGVAQAQHNLGAMYYHGHGVPQDYTEAVTWYVKAAAQGHAWAQQDLGNMARFGAGVPKDYTVAAIWWWMAAEQGLALAQYNLGDLYDRGAPGVPQDHAEAAKWYRLAAEQGEGNSQFRLGVMYAKGLGVPPEFVQAHMWLNLADPHFKVRWKVRQELKWFVPEMTSDQIAEAQRLAREWMERNQQDNTKPAKLIDPGLEAHTQFRKSSGFTDAVARQKFQPTNQATPLPPNITILKAKPGSLGNQ